MKNEPSSSHSTDPHFEYLLKAAGRIQSRPSEWALHKKQHHPDEAMPGDIWVTKRPDEDSAESWVIILSAKKLNGTPILKVAPIFHETTFANDQDVILPAALLGFEAGVAFGCTVTTVPSALSRLVTHATGEWFRQLQQFDSFLNGSAERPQKLESGIPYLDSLDSRRDFHAELLQNLNRVQGALADEIDMEMTGTEEAPDGWAVEIPFYASWLEDTSLAAAADDEMRYTARYNIEGMEETLQCFAFQDDDQIHFLVWDNQGNPSSNLDGYTLQSAGGGTPASIKKGEVRLPLGASRGSFLLKNRDGHPVRLILAADLGNSRILNDLFKGRGIAFVGDDDLLPTARLLDGMRPCLSAQIRGEVLLRHWLYNGERPDVIQNGVNDVLASASASLGDWFKSIPQSQPRPLEAPALAGSEIEIARWIVKRIAQFQNAHGIIPVVQDNVAFPVPFEIADTRAEVCFTDENGRPIPAWETKAGHLWALHTRRRIRVFHPNGSSLTGGSFALPVLLAMENDISREMHPRSILATGAINETGIVGVQYCDLKQELAKKLGVRIWIQPGGGSTRDDALFISPGTPIQEALSDIRTAPQYQLALKEISVEKASDILRCLMNRSRFDENDIDRVSRCINVLEKAADEKLYRQRLVEGRAHLAALYNHAGRPADADRILKAMSESANRSLLFQGRPMGKRVENLTDMGRLREAREFGVRFVQFVEDHDDETEAWNQLRLEAYGSFGGEALGHTALRTGCSNLIQEGKNHLERCLTIANDLRRLHPKSIEHFKSAARLLLWKVFFQPGSEVFIEIAEQERQAAAEPGMATVQFLRRYRFVMASRWILQGKDPAELSWNAETEWQLPEVTHDFLRWVRASALRGLGALYADLGESKRAEECFLEAIRLLQAEIGPVIVMVRWSVAAQAVWSLRDPGNEVLRVLREDLGCVLDYLRADETGVELARALEASPENKEELKKFLLQHPY